MSNEVKWESLKSLMNGLLEECKESKKSLQMFKHLAVKTKQFELAATLRDMETTLFPLTEEQEAAKKEARTIKTVFDMIEVNASEDTCWLIFQAIKKYQKMKGKFSIREASELIASRKELFENEKDNQ